MAVTDASITASSAGVFIPELWRKGTLDAVEFGAIIQKRVNTDYKSDLTVGNTLHIPRLSNLSTQTKTSGIGNTISFESITETKQDITVSTHQYAAFLIENVAEVQTNQDLRAPYERKIGYALARGRDVSLAGLFGSITYASVGALGQELLFQDFLDMWTNWSKAGLLEESPDPGEDFSIILSSSAYANLMKIDQITNKDYAGTGDALTRATIGRFMGVPIYTSQLLASPAAGQVNAVAFRRDGFALIVQKEVPMKSQFLIRNIADGIVGWNLYGQAEVLFPPETPGGGTAVGNRNQLVKTLV